MAVVIFLCINNLAITCFLIGLVHGLWIACIYVLMFLIISLLANYYISKGITRIAVPYFFVASGFFYFVRCKRGVLSGML